MKITEHTIRGMFMEIEDHYLRIGDKFSRIDEQYISPSFFRTISDIVKDDSDLEKMSDDNLRWIRKSLGYIIYFAAALDSKISDELINRKNWTFLVGRNINQ